MVLKILLPPNSRQNFAVRNLQISSLCLFLSVFTLTCSRPNSVSHLKYFFLLSSIYCSAYLYLAILCLLSLHSVRLNKVVFQVRTNRVKKDWSWSSSSFIKSKAVILFLFPVPTAPPPVSIYSGHWEKEKKKTHLKQIPFPYCSMEASVKCNMSKHGEFNYVNIQPGSCNWGIKTPDQIQPFCSPVKTPGQFCFLTSVNITLGKILQWYESRIHSLTQLCRLSHLLQLSHILSKENWPICGQRSLQADVFPQENVMACHVGVTQIQGCFYSMTWWKLLSLNLDFIVKLKNFKNLQNIFMVSIFSATILKAMSADWMSIFK